MNKRVRELAEQARDYTDKAIDCGWLNGDEIFEGKFAQLIVRECAELMPQDNLYKMVLKHFGVEE